MSATFEASSRSTMTPDRIRARAPALEAVRAYATTHVHTVQGWLQAGPRAAIWALLDGQILDGVAGEIMEIGVFHGRTFGLLAASLADGERAIAVDPFGSDQRRDAFLRNVKRLGIDRSRMDLWEMTSEAFSETADCAALKGRVRFLSLDGSHDQEAVAADLKISELAISPEGIVAFDDFFNPWYPEVTAALFDHLAGPTSLIPFAIAVNFGPPSRGANKLFLCRAPAVNRYRATLRRALKSNLRKERVWQGVEVDVFDFEKGVLKLDPLLLIAPNGAA
jgi:hypothetical protein